MVTMSPSSIPRSVPMKGEEGLNLGVEEETEFESCSNSRPLPGSLLASVDLFVTLVELLDLVRRLGFLGD